MARSSKSRFASRVSRRKRKKKKNREKEKKSKIRERERKYEINVVLQKGRHARARDMDGEINEEKGGTKEEAMAAPSCGTRKTGINVGKCRRQRDRELRDGEGVRETCKIRVGTRGRGKFVNTVQDKYSRK